MVNFDPRTGALELDERFRDAGSDKPGVSMDGKAWPHGFRGDAYPHGTGRQGNLFTCRQSKKKGMCALH